MCPDDSTGLAESSAEGDVTIPAPARSSVTSPVVTRLIRFLEEITPNAQTAYTPETRIFSTGLFDSLALVQLVVWVERETGSQLDVRSLDFQREWATVADIAAFIERGRAGEASAR